MAAAAAAGVLRALRRPLPDAVDEPRAYVVYTRLLVRVLTPYARGDVVFEAPRDADALEVVRVRCAELWVAARDDASLLTPLGVDDDMYSLFTLTLLAGLVARAALVRATPPPNVPWLREYLERAELCVWPPALRTVAAVTTWAQLEDAVRLLAAGVTSTVVVSDARDSLTVYLGALEGRVALFAADAVAEPAPPAPTFVDVLKVTHTLLAVRRVIDWAKRVTAPTTYALELGAATRSLRILVGADGIGTYRARVEAFIRREAVACALEEHRVAFGRAAQRYLAATGESATHARFYGLGGVERPHVGDLLERRMTPDAIDYWSDTLFDRPLVTWLDDRANPLRGGVHTLRVVEDLAVLYILTTTVMSRINVDWPRYFLVTHERAEATYCEYIARAIVAGMPVVVQTAGEWSVFMPTPDVTRVLAAERELGIAHAQSASARGHRAYVCADVFVALGVWASLMTHVLHGGVPNTPSVSFTTVLDSMRASVAPPPPPAP